MGIWLFTQMSRKATLKLLPLQSLAAGQVSVGDMNTHPSSYRYRLDNTKSSNLVLSAERGYQNLYDSTDRK